MSIKTIYDQLRAVGMTAEGACGLMGNMMAESSMKADIAQRDMTALTDRQYTATADAGTIDFAHDAVGYGLCQWTFHSRKAKLIAFARARGVSVGDEDMQVQFCVKELREDFPGVWAVLTGSHDLYECARIVCLQYERPAVNNVDVRYRFAQDFFRAAGPDPQPPPSPERGDPIVRVLQTCMAYDGYWPADQIDGIKTPAYREAIVKYAADVAGC